MNKRKYYPAAVALYITYFILGISATIVGQYKQEFAAAWGAERLADGTFEISRVMAVIAAIGLGRLVAFPVAGPFSDSFGRKRTGGNGVFHCVFRRTSFYNEHGSRIYSAYVQRNRKFFSGYQRYAVLHGNFQ